MNSVYSVFSVFKLSLVFLLVFYSGHAAIINAGDSTKSKYDLNDPRNPNCPCHKYQKQAEEEYQKLLASQGKLQAGFTSQNGNAENTSLSNSERSGTRFKHSKIRKHRRKKGGRHHGRERKQRKSWGCVHFR